MHTSTQWATHYGLRPADVIKSPKSLLDLIQHYALFWGYDTHGHAWVMENVVGQGVVFTRMDHFMQRVGSITAIQRYPGHETARRQVLARAEARIGRTYDALHYNCEHFVNDALYGITISKQADNARGLFGGLLSLALVAVILRAA